LHIPFRNRLSRTETSGCSRALAAFVAVVPGLFMFAHRVSSPVIFRLPCASSGSALSWLADREGCVPVHDSCRLCVEAWSGSCCRPPRPDLEFSSVHPSTISTHCALGAKPCKMTEVRVTPRGPQALGPRWRLSAARASLSV